MDLLADTRCLVGESPLWDEKRRVLFFVDIPAPAIHALEIESGVLRSWSMPAPVGSIGLCRSGRLIAALGTDVVFFDIDRGSSEPLASIPGEPASNRLNDGKVGPDGAFWVGSMDEREDKQPVASLYRVSADGGVERKIDGLRVSNGLAWSPDGRTMYHADSRGPWIDRWIFDPATGAITDRRRFADLDDSLGRPDGAACDAAGTYWSAGVSAGRLNGFHPNGRLVWSIACPVPRPTMPCFFDKDLDRVALTSLRAGLSGEDLAAEPHSGGIFAMQADTPGVAITRFFDR